MRQKNEVLTDLGSANTNYTYYPLSYNTDHVVDAHTNHQQ